MVQTIKDGTHKRWIAPLGDRGAMVNQGEDKKKPSIAARLFVSAFAPKRKKSKLCPWHSFENKLEPVFLFYIFAPVKGSRVSATASPATIGRLADEVSGLLLSLSKANWLSFIR